jgi:hypothetical protein
VYSSAVLLYGCESWCLTAESVRRLTNWHNKRVREMCRVTMCQTFVHRITSESLQKRTGVFSLEHYLASRTLLWAGRVARMPKNRLPKRLMLSWIREPYRSHAVPLHNPRGGGATEKKADPTTQHALIGFKHQHLPQPSALHTQPHLPMPPHI